MRNRERAGGHEQDGDGHERPAPPPGRLGAVPRAFRSRPVGIDSDRLGILHRDLTPGLRTGISDRGRVAGMHRPEPFSTPRRRPSPGSLRSLRRSCGSRCRLCVPGSTPGGGSLTSRGGVVIASRSRRLSCASLGMAMPPCARRICASPRVAAPATPLGRASIRRAAPARENGENAMATSSAAAERTILRSHSPSRRALLDRTGQGLRSPRDARRIRRCVLGGDPRSPAHAERPT